MARKTDRKQVSVSMTEAEYKQFEELAIDLRLRKDSDVLKLAVTNLGDQHGRTIFTEDTEKADDGENQLSAE